MYKTLGYPELRLLLHLFNKDIPSIPQEYLCQKTPNGFPFAYLYLTVTLSANLFGNVWSVSKTKACTLLEQTIRPKRKDGLGCTLCEQLPARPL